MAARTLIDFAGKNIHSVPRFGGAGKEESEERCVQISNPDDYVLKRAIDLAEAIYARFGENKYYTMAVGVAVDKRGCCHKLIATSKKHLGKMPPEVRILAPSRYDEIIAPGAGHAEQNIVECALGEQWKLVSIGATRPVCPACVAAIGYFGR